MRAAAAWLLAAWFAAPVLGAAIIGIDFGSEFIKVASVQPGKAFDIVMNENSKRKQPNALAFDRGNRLYGSDAVSLNSRDPAHVFNGRGTCSVWKWEASK
jgi:hypoxia up-regulated 1